MKLKNEMRAPACVQEPAASPVARGQADIAGRGEDAAPKIPAGTAPAYEELSRFFDESPDLLCIADDHGRFKRLNPSWHSALGWTCEELQAKPFLDFVHPADRPATLAEMAKLDAGSLTVTFENRYHCKDRSLKWLQWTARPVPGRREIYAIARDITQRKRMEQQVLEILDRERERMARELHDGICQDLAGIAALSTSLARRLAARSEPESAAAREIGKLLGETIRHARDLARGHDPLRLDAIGLAAALADFCAKTEAMFQVSCTFLGPARPPGLGAKREAHLYRIVQEAVHNAISHGRASAIEIHLSCQSGGGTLSILDDGLGVSAPPDSAHFGSGLHSMAYRASLLGGSLEIRPKLPAGTAVTCGFPRLAKPPPP